MKLAHHIIWEATNGPIPEGYLVHHIDKNKQNNDIENLQLVTPENHQKIHSPYYGLLDGKWVRLCTDCREIHLESRRGTCDKCRARRARIERRINKAKR